MTDINENTAEPMSAALSNAKKVFLICVAIALPICIYLIFFADGVFFQLNGHGRFALALAIVFSALGAFFFMGISFFSSRSGIDDQPNYVKIVEKHRNEASKNEG